MGAEKRLRIRTCREKKEQMISKYVKNVILSGKGNGLLISPSSLCDFFKKKSVWHVSSNVNQV